ncbi:MAG: alpha/beta hydrolase [Bacteroidota bacterium]|nr:alpha/beta hydrolase [Bacteroidota bacterium]
MKAYFCTVNGRKLSICEQGKGFPIIWMHGLMMNMKVDQAIGLAGFDGRFDNYRVIRIDAPGHGMSEGTLNSDDYKWSSLPSTIIGLADQLGIDRFIASGFSMGSAAAIETAVQYPDRVEAVVLCMPPVIWEDRPVQCGSYLRMTELAEQGRLLRFLPRLLNSTPVPVAFVEAGQPGTTSAVLDQMCSLRSEYYAPILQGAALSDYPNREVLSLLTKPTLIIGWKDDPTHPQKSCDELIKVLPNAKFHIASCFDEFLQLKQHVEDFLSCITALNSSSGRMMPAQL